MRYHVFIDGCRDTTAAGVEHLAGALGQRYGMSAPALLRRLKEGRFCARASLELAPAQELVAELEALGARVSLVDEGTPPVAGPTQPRPAQNEGQGREGGERGQKGEPGRPPARPPAPQREASPAAGPASLASGAPRYESGLAAAFAGDRLRDDVRLDLGPLAAGAPDEENPTLGERGWELAHIDGTRETEAAPGSPSLRPARPTPAATLRGTPPPALVRPAGPASTAGPSRDASSRGHAHPGRDAQAAPSSSPVRAPAPDPFQPPDAGRQDLPELAEVPRRVPATATSSAAAPGPPGSPRPVVAAELPLAPGSSTLVRPSIPARIRDAVVRSARARFAAGVALAFLIGLVPAQLYAWSRTRSIQDDIRADLMAVYRKAETTEQWAELASARDDSAELARSRRQRLAISSCLLWLAAAGAAAFVWFRWIDWGPGEVAGGAQLAGSPSEAARSAAARRRPTM